MYCARNRMWCLENSIFHLHRQRFCSGEQWENKRQRGRGREGACSVWHSKWSNKKFFNSEILKFKRRKRRKIIEGEREREENKDVILCILKSVFLCLLFVLTAVSVSTRTSFCISFYRRSMRQYWEQMRQSLFWQQERWRERCRRTETGLARTTEG